MHTTAQRPTLSTNEVRRRLHAFAHQWQGASSERADEKLYTADFLACFGLEKHHYQREYAVKKQDGSTGYMDGFIPGLLIIEGKSLGKDLAKARQQAEDYRWACPPAQQPRFVLLHDFARLALFDLSSDQSHECSLADLPGKAHWFSFLYQNSAPLITEETEADRQAAEQMAQLHQGLLLSNFKGRELEIFLTRLLFCLFADDTALFGDKDQFTRFLHTTRADGADLGERLAKLFDILNQAPDERSRLLDDDLAAFAYINGQLFAERTRTPDFDSALRQQLLACAELDWSHISPAIFGAMFQGVLEQGEPSLSRTASRRELGAHYTSERNILRAINPLFMDGLRAELAAAGKQRPKLQALYERLPHIRIFDPACGCGNFLVIAYRELRRLEHELIERLFFAGKDRGLLDISTLSHVSVSQFYGIEIDASAAHIAQVALWITDLQLNIEAASRFGTTRPSVPLAHSAHIHHGNALQTDWAQVLPPAQCSFIVGNPPFVGSTYRSKEQTADAERVTGHIPSWGLLDFVACWHVQATAYMQANPAIRTALVSTNSICQGQQVPILWAHLLAQGVHIHFAHRTFQWSNEGKGVAAVHCIILGFALQAPATAPRVFDYSANIQGEPEEATAKYINPYLVDAPAVLVDKRRKPLQAFVKEMANGGKPTEGGNLLLTQDEADSIRTSDSIAAQYIRPYLMGDEFINNKPRYCLWLTEANSADKANSPELKQRLAAVRQMRESSKKPATQKLADTPHLFGEIRQPSSDTYLAIPKVSSERRRFIPIGFLSKEVICGDKIFFVDQAGLYHLGILSSTMHNAWMRTVAGRLKSDYSYSNTIVYNNYPWPQTISDKQQAVIEAAAQAVLDARALEFARCAKAGQACSLALLYNPDTMPAKLVQAHTQLDRAVDAAYAYKGGKDDAPRVAFLFGLYQQLAAPLDTPAAKKASRRKKPAE